MLHRITAALLIFVSILFVLVKLFTVELTYQDEPSIALAVRSAPAFSNDIQLDASQEFSDFAVLFMDENGYPGMRLYRWITGWLWWLVPGITFIIIPVFMVLLRMKPKSR